MAASWTTAAFLGLAALLTAAPPLVTDAAARPPWRGGPRAYSVHVPPRAIVHRGWRGPRVRARGPGYAYRVRIGPTYAPRVVVPRGIPHGPPRPGYVGPYDYDYDYDAAPPETYAPTPPDRGDAPPGDTYEPPELEMAPPETLREAPPSDDPDAADLFEGSEGDEGGYDEGDAALPPGASVEMLPAPPRGDAAATPPAEDGLDDFFGPELPSAAPAPGRAADGSMEAAILTEMNLFRQDPAAYARKLERLRPYYDGKLLRVPGEAPIMTTEGVAALDEAIAVLKRSRPLGLLRPSAGLAQAAAAHAQDLGANDFVGHDGTDGSTPDSRVRRFGTWGGIVGENITFGSETAEDVVIDLLVDDGVADRGHRELMLRGDLRVAGVACEEHPTYRLACVVDYAATFTDAR